MDENTKNGLWNFYVNEYNTEGSIRNIEPSKDECDKPYKKSLRKSCFDSFFKPYLDAQEGNGIYNFEESNQHFPQIPVPAEVNFGNPNELCKSEEFTIDAIRRILGFGIQRPCCKEIDDMPIPFPNEMADKSMQSPKGIKENVLVKISNLVFPVDFIVLDIMEDENVPIILGRPMLATAHAKIDVYGKKISLGVEKIQGSISINRGLIQAIPTSLPPQPIGEATKASNLQRIPPGVQGRSHFTYFLYLIVQNTNTKPGQILDEDQLAFLVDLGVPDGQIVHTIIPNNAAFHIEDLDTYDSDCDDISNAQRFMANISNYEKANKEQNNESVTAELERYKERVKTFEQRLNIDLSSREKMIDSQMDDMIREKLALKEQVDSLEKNLSKQIKEKECLLQTFTVFKNESKEKEDKYMENKIDLEKKIKELDNILFKVGQSAQTMHMLTKPQAFYDNIHKQALGYQNPFHLKKAQRINHRVDVLLCLENCFAMHVIELTDDFGKHFTPQQELSAEQAFWLRMSNPTSKPSDALPVKIEAPKELPKISLMNESLKKLKIPLVVKINRLHLDALTKGRIISQTPSRNMKNKVEAQPRKVNKKIRVVEPISDDNVKYSKLNANAHLNYATCKKSMFDDVHDMCILDFVKNVNSRAKFAKKHTKQDIWKATGHVFTEVGLKWKPTSITFTIVGNSCPLTRITSANVVPPKKTTSHSVETQKPKLKVYNRKPKTVKNVVSNIPSSSSLVMTVRFRNDHIARIIGYGDYQLGNVTISRVYYVEGLGHDLFSVGQFCDGDLEVAFQKNTCFICNLEGIDLLSGSRDTNLYTISLDDMLKTSPICLLSKASKTKSWLWHRRLSHLNFDTLYKLAKDGLARDFRKIICVQHVFLRTKDEAPEAIIKYIKNIQVRLNGTIRNVRTDNGTEFVNQTLCEFYEMLASRNKHLLSALLNRTTLSKGETELL
ncbi:integrase, catalytic region, zinc finger, CCHC-type containing protein [Tanacetum coccineum]